MRFLYVVIVLTALLALAQSASANLLVYDSFEYSNASLGTAGSPNWVKNGGSPDPTVVTGGLSYPGFSDSSNSLKYDGSGVNQGSGVPNATDGRDLTGPNGGSPLTSGAVYYSLLLKVNAIQTFPGGSSGNGWSSPTSNLAQGAFMAGLQTLVASAAPATATIAAPLCIRPTNPSPTQFTTTFQLGTARTSLGPDRTYTANSYNLGDTIFIVVKYTFGANSPTDDTATIYVNPSLDAEPVILDGNDVNVTGGTALNLGTPAGIKSFFVRNNSVEPDDQQIDELRIGTSWLDVTPEPGSAGLALCCAGMLLNARRDRRRRAGGAPRSDG